MATAALGLSLTLAACGSDEQADPGGAADAVAPTDEVAAPTADPSERQPDDGTDDSSADADAPGGEDPDAAAQPGTGNDAATAPDIAAETDPAVLAQAMAEGATGDTEWIAVFADLRARAWLAFRYPERPELETTYSPRLLEAGVAENMAHHAEIGVYLDETFPQLISVTLIRSVGDQIHLDVVQQLGPSVFRNISDDSVEQTLFDEERLGRGMIVLVPAQPDDPDRPWRIDQIIELALTDEEDP